MPHLEFFKTYNKIGYDCMKDKINMRTENRACEIWNMNMDINAAY